MHICPKIDIKKWGERRVADGLSIVSLLAGLVNPINRAIGKHINRSIQTNYQSESIVPTEYKRTTQMKLFIEYSSKNLKH